jgi:hypothetical protein
MSFCDSLEERLALAADRATPGSLTNLWRRCSQSKAL